MLKKTLEAAHEDCRLRGMDPAEIRRPVEVLTTSELTRMRRDYTDILDVVHVFSRQVLQSLEGTPLLIVISDEDGYILDIRGDATIRGMIQQLGIESGVRFTLEDLGPNVISLALTEQLPVALIGDDHYFQFLHATACYSSPFRYTDDNTLLGTISVMTTIDHENYLFLHMLTNVVGSIERELLLRRQNEKLDVLNQIMMERTQNAVIVTDAEGIVTEYNASAERISGFARDRIIGLSIFDSPITGDYFRKVLSKGKIFKDAEINVNNDGQPEYICLFDAQPIYDAKDEKIIGGFAQLRDITERHRLQEQYNYLAYHDELTGLPNRRFFQNELEKLIQRDEKNIGLLLIDLDGFKNINDTFGHSNGDQLLQAVAQRLRIIISGRGLLFRISGDEFLVMIQELRGECHLNEAATEILKDFQRPFSIEDRSLHITASIGGAVYEHHPPDLESYMVHVDAAMYKAKSLGKNDYRMFSPEMHLHSREDLLMESDLRNAMDREELILYYQPIVDVTDGSIACFEALIRWKHPESGLLSPGRFIPLAERTGLIVPIGEWVIREACRQHQEWKRQGLPPTQICVNISAQQFLKKNFVQTIAGALEAYDINPKYLDIEITESMAMDFTYAENVLRELRSLGLHLSMDDFGTGYSSLYYLKRFNIQTLKIDKTFIDDLAGESNDSVLISTMLAMADTLGMKAVAEGVESKEQLDRLLEAGSPLIQGFYFSPPLSPGTIQRTYTELTDTIKRKAGKGVDLH
ncbi:putative bifunctional diguanylate cyclase/phosphodiesterase [Alkalicoccus urumqiensis]|uniref:Diguanylate cyclase n=1 Tax=Alkalicoccus urumqiensis TaxID=1548213 RepID=A0A2P6MIC8_ALKUR|nr:EAL domain-containing protein [Alkalicoccus urumqiensis]PRO66044.1 diguanylate cyclase [Alkalicoccus urumqiensis]